MEIVFTGGVQCVREIVSMYSYLSRCRIKFPPPYTTIKAQYMSYFQCKEKDFSFKLKS